ncbi:ABC transporter permease [Demequina rhizosphaerae]|uniref:ABC transporter permease n=1 Tax=Demequina rhizosphaerae TaxID=1638985 RepID=UPI0007852E2A|nr:ABC transporter permease [Demequina rhizosphaerae]
MTTQTAPQATEAAPRPAAIASALASGTRPRRPGALSESLTFGWRALLKIKHSPEQLLDVTLSPVLMVLLFTYLFGGAIAGSVDHYIAYLGPGVLVQSVLIISMYTGATLREDIDKGVFDRFRALPIWRPSALVGMLLGDTVRYTIAAAVTAVACVIVGWRPEGGVAGIAAGTVVMLVFAFALSWIWTFIAMLVSSQRALMGIAWIAVMPLVFGSNIFVEPSTMPGWLQGWVDVNPVSHAVTAVRALMNGADVGTELVWVAGWSAVLVAVFGSLTMWRYRDPR